MQRVDDADAAARETARDGLGVEQAGIHLRGFVEEEDLQQRHGFLGVFLLAVEGVGGRQGRDSVSHVAQGQAMGGEVLRVGLAVTLNVGQAVRLVRVGPPVVAVGVEIVRAAFAELARDWVIETGATLRASSASLRIRWRSRSATSSLR